MTHNEKALKLFKIRAFVGANVVTYLYGLTTALAGLLLSPTWTCRLAAGYFGFCFAVFGLESRYRLLASKEGTTLGPPKTFWKLMFTRRWGE